MADNSDVETLSYKVDHSVRKCILAETTTLEDISYGFLIGDEAENCCQIVTCIKCTNHEKSPIDVGIKNKPHWIIEISEICSLIPTGIKICGVWCISKDYQEWKQSTVEEIFSAIDLQNELVHNKQLLWSLKLESEGKDEDKAFVYNLKNRCIKKPHVSFDSIIDGFCSSRITFRVKSKFEVCVAETKGTDICMSMSKSVTQLCNKLQSATFHIPQRRLLIGNGVIHDKKKSCEELLQDIVDDDWGFSQGQFYKNRKLKENRKDVLNVQLVESLSRSKERDNHDCVPIIFSQKREASYLNIALVVDLLVMVPLNTSISLLPSLFIRGIKDQLQAILCCVETYSKDTVLYVPKVYHFKTPQTAYLTTCIYPWKHIDGEIIEDTEFENQRSSLLKKLLIPSQRPTLHPNNNYVFQDDRSEASYLINPHEGLSTPGGAGCCVAVVDGCYSYYHYMQDNFDDNKWGCAYRSLQTICSWFRLQGYTEKAVPGHRSIQEALVAVGDKQSSFIGSKKWIGSFEVSLCLEYFLGITSKILALNSGAELQNKGRELIHHFQTQGTPVMIGGGVLAHTILGVSFNDRTGDIKFLILDPHYTGGEDLKTILDKGWCGWKSHLFWNQQAHYNLCMPQRPTKV